MEFWLYDRWDNQSGALNGLSSAVHYQEAGGENSLTITSNVPMCEGDRVVWRDDMGDWHEHIVSNTTDSREGGAIACEAFCEDALNETFSDKVDEKRVRSGSALEALSKVLEQTRWEVGTVSVSGVRTISFYHCSVGECLQEIAKAWGCEVYSSFEVDGNGIAKRKVNLVPAMGRRSTHKRFEYGKDLVNIKRSIDSTGVKTAMRGYGKGEQVGDDAWGRRLTFEGINGGLDYVADSEALELWGRPDGKGGKAHAFGTVIFNECEDAEELKRLTQAELDKVKEPVVSYACSVADLKSMGFAYEGVGVGDDVDVVDSGFAPPIRVNARVMSIKRNLLDKSDVEVVIGNLRDNASSKAAKTASQVNTIERRSANWDVAANTPVSYLQQVIDGLNKQFNEQGMSYMHISFENGLIFSNSPLDEHGRLIDPVDYGNVSGIQINSQGFRIANEADVDNTFMWRTFGTGEGFTADEFIGGVIRSADYMSYWDLDTGDVLLNNGVIHDSLRRSEWNLSDGTFETDRMVAKNMVAEGISAKGSFECGYPRNRMLMASGKIEGWERDIVYFPDGTYEWGDDHHLGTIDYSAHYLKDGKDVSGLKLYGKDVTTLVTPILAVRSSENEGETTYITLTKDLDQTYVMNYQYNGNGTITFKMGRFILKFEHGFCTVATGTQFE